MNLLDLFYPKFCVGCNSFGHYLCFDCQKTTQPPDAVFDEDLIPLDGLWSLAHYSGVIEDLIHTLKYRWVTDILNELTTLISKELQSVPLLYTPDLIIPVPLHPKRYSWRGFNQSELLAREVSKILNIPMQNALSKVRVTKPQVGLEAAEREDNLKNAFIIREESSVAGLNILLIDDVWTTGSTMKECGKVLKEAGAEQVYAFTLAR